MKIKDRIVVATDLSAASLLALRRAVALACAHKCTLDIVHVVEFSIFKSAKKAQAAGLAALKRFVVEHLGDAVEFGLFCYSGDVAVELDKHTSERDAALVVVGASGESGAYLGSATTDIIKKSPRPVLVVRCMGGAYETILSPSDFSDNSLKLCKFVRKFFPKSKLVLYHMINRPFGLRLGSYGASDEEILELYKNTDNDAKDNARKFMRHFDGGDIMLDSGVLGSAKVFSAADSKCATLIALPTSGKVSFFALDVLQDSHTDVLIWDL